MGILVVQKQREKMQKLLFETLFFFERKFVSDEKRQSLFIFQIAVKILRNLHPSHRHRRSHTFECVFHISNVPFVLFLL